MLGKGVVLGKYTYTDGATYEVTDFNEEVIAGPDDKAYKEALAIAKNSGNGQTDINFGYGAPHGGIHGANTGHHEQIGDGNYIDLKDVREQEDMPDTYALKA